MHELLLLRHAEASAAALDGNDFQRPLTTSGREAARAAAARLTQQSWRPERVLCSPALRTRETAALIAAVLRLEGAQLLEVPELYLATTQALRKVLQAHQQQCARLMIVGHNPGLSDWGAGLATRHHGKSLPTAGYWLIEFTDSTWRKLLKP